MQGTMVAYYRRFGRTYRGPIFKGMLNVRRWTDRVSRNVGKTPRRKPEIPYQATQLETNSLVQLTNKIIPRTF